MNRRGTTDSSEVTETDKSLYLTLYMHKVVCVSVYLFNAFCNLNVDVEK